MQNFLRWVVGLPIAVIVVAFAIANRVPTIVSFDPFSRENSMMSVEMPLWALFFVGAFLGLIAGWITCWFAQGKWRRSAKDARRELSRMQAEASAEKPVPPMPVDNWP
jgi:uncharacterized membrane protein YciS (DUF1049 family)